MRRVFVGRVLGHVVNAQEAWVQQLAARRAEQVMRGAIRDEDLGSVQRIVPSLVSLSLNEEQAALVVIGAVLVVIGLLIPRKRARLNSH